MAEWTTQYINDLDDDAFLYIEDGGTKDDDGRTVPRALRHFPYRDAAGTIDLPHLRNAAARIPQSDLPQAVKDRLARRVEELLAGESPAQKSADPAVLAHAIKFNGADTVVGLAFPFGGRDTDGEFFTPETDFCLEWFGKSGRPSLWLHGMDPALKGQVVGRQSDYEIRDGEGIWAQVQLEKNARYRKAIDGLIEAGAVGYSGGAMQHLATKSVSGAIEVFPWVELSMTPEPAHPSALNVHYLKSADAAAHWEQAGIEIPSPLKAALSALDAWAEDRDDPDALPDGASFADVLVRSLDDAKRRVTARKAWHAKSGRVLSAATRERLVKHPSQLRELADDLDALLTSADAEKTTTDLAALQREHDQAEARYARLLGAPIPTGS